MFLCFEKDSYVLVLGIFPATVRIVSCGKKYTMVCLGNEYPVATIREMLLNALVHRTYMGSMIQIRVYDNKLSLWNEGNLPEGMTVESLKRHHISRPRNPLIADVCFKTV